jgi:hypothetical protein
MDILIMMIVVFVVVFIMTQNSRNFEARLALEQKKKRNCPPHKWVYREQPGTDYEYMVCSACGMLPGGQYVEENNVED